MKAAALQIAAIVHKPKGIIITRKVLYQAFERWIDGERTPGIEFRLTLWDGRVLDSPFDYSAKFAARSESLAKALRRLLRDGRIPFREVGSRR